VNRCFERASSDPLPPKTAVRAIVVLPENYFLAMYQRLSRAEVTVVVPMQRRSSAVFVLATLLQLYIRVYR